MSPVNPDDLHNVARTASDYWVILDRIIPISLLGGATAVTVNILRIANERTWMRRMLALVSVISVGCVAAGVAALGIKLCIPAPTPEVELLAGAVAGSSGQKIFDIYARHLFGLRTRVSELVSPDEGSGVGRTDSDPDDKNRK